MDVATEWLQNLLTSQMADISVDSASNKSEAVAAACVSCFASGTLQNLRHWEASTSADSQLKLLAALGLQGPLAYAEWEPALVYTAATQSSIAPAAPAELLHKVDELKEVCTASMTCLAALHASERLSQRHNSSSFGHVECRMHCCSINLPMDA